MNRDGKNSNFFEWPEECCEDCRDKSKNFLLKTFFEMLQNGYEHQPLRQNTSLYQEYISSIGVTERVFRRFYFTRALSNAMTS